MFAAKHAEAVFTGGGVPSDAVPYVTSIREMAAANGRGAGNLSKSSDNRYLPLSQILLKSSHSFK